MDPDDLADHLSGYDRYVAGTNQANLYDLLGYQPYRLLAYLSTLFHHQTLIDYHASDGSAAYALAYQGDNTVLSFDKKINVINKVIKSCSQIEWIASSPLENERILQSSLIYLDLVAHDGQQEKQIYDWLLEHHYQGLLVCNHIWASKEMRDFFWSQIPMESKWDVTSCGHPNGTGIIAFSHNNDHLLPLHQPTHDWTLVTAYFDLTHASDTNDSVRSKDYYMAHAHATLAVPYNLVVYCDPGSLEQIKQLRPHHLLSRTRFVTMDFESLQFQGHPDVPATFNQYRDTITKNRQVKPYQFDPRNNASYYLFCMSRYLLMKRTIDDNPFRSTHFAWINICMERMGYRNLVHLDQALAVHRDRFSTCYIDYQSPDLVKNTHEYFRMGRCSMCSGFFTGQTQYMYLVCHAIEQQFLDYLAQGYGHADEQLYSPVYLQHPEWFQHYYGDYQEMITNYVYVHDNPTSPITKFIHNSYGYQNYAKCHEACQFVWDSYVKHKCQISTEDLKNLCFYLNTSGFSLRSFARDTTPPTTPPPNAPTSLKEGAMGDGSPPTTIITLLYDVGNPQHLSTMLAQVNQWLSMSYPIILWTNRSCYETLKLLFFNKKNVLIYQREIDEFETHQYLEQIQTLEKNYVIQNRNANKDTLTYHMLMYSRPLMWAESIRKNPFHTKTFICMDFGLFRFTPNLSVVETWHVKDKLKLLMIYPYFATDPAPKEYFHYTRHNVAGGLLTGSGDNILHYVDLFHQEFLDMIKEQWYQLDEALTTCLTRKYPEMFDYLYGDYAGILANYEVIHEMLNIPETIQRYLDHREFHQAQKVVDMLDYHMSEKTLYYFVEYSILTNYYTMNGFLNPLVRRILSDPTKAGLRTVIETRHKSNLSFYKD